MHFTDYSLGLEHLICPVVILARKATGKPGKKLLISTAGYYYKETEMIQRQRENGFGGEYVSSTVIVKV